MGTVHRGGGASEKLAPHFNSLIYSDINQGLILFWQQVQANLDAGNDPVAGFPEEVSKELYDQLRAEPEDSALKFLVGISASFGGKYYGGYARGKTAKGEPRNYHQETLRNIRKGAPLMFPHQQVQVLHRPYWEAPELEDGAVLYCDPPYAGTTTYQSGEFDSGRFWEWARGMANAGHPVFVSEYSAPDWATLLWEKELTVTVKRGDALPGERQWARERLFLVEPE